MKSLLAISLVSFVFFAAVNASAAQQPSKNQLLTQCKSLINAEFDDVNRIKMTKMKSRRGNFEAKFRVFTDDERAMYLCTVEKNQAPQLVRLDKADPQLASGQ